jgi:peptide-methionine (S)-S-oxide reductase
MALIDRLGASKVRDGIVFAAAAILVAGVVGFAALTPKPGYAVEPMHRLPPPAASAAPAADSETAVFAGGCFWGVQGVFAHVKGVRQVVSGYAGGGGSTATYEQVSTGETGHAESVRITFDPRQVSYGQLLQIFFSVATDPTQLNRQLPDEGTQYRSAIFYASGAQKAVAQTYIAQLGRAHAFSRPIVTEVSPLRAFYRAEAEHQDYLTLNPQAPYITRYDLPKVAALKTLFPEVWRKAPVLTTAG